MYHEIERSNVSCLFNRFFDSNGSKLRYVNFEGIEDDEDVVWSARNVHFYYDCNYETEPMLLKILHLRYEGISMSRECLEYVFSGVFSKLESLSLVITVAQDALEKDRIKLFDKIRSFCESSATLQRSEVCLRREFDGEVLYSLERRGGYMMEDRPNLTPREPGDETGREWEDDDDDDEEEEPTEISFGFFPM